MNRRTIFKDVGSEKPLRKRKPVVGCEKAFLMRTDQCWHGLARCVAAVVVVVVEDDGWTSSSWMMEVKEGLFIYLANMQTRTTHTHT